MDTTQTLTARLQHDARTPLNSILGMVELLENTSLSQDQRLYVNVLRRATEELLAVVEGLPQAPDTVAPAPSQPSLSGRRILLVDDAEDNRFLVVRYLRGSGAVIEEAQDGAQAVEMVRRTAYDVVLMDVEMPVLDGFSATRAIREWERVTGHAPVKIVALTAHEPTEVLGESRSAGCDELITKPVRKSTLLAALEQNEPSADIADLIPAYLMKRRADLITLRRALDVQDFDAIRALAHKLAGTGTGYGLPKVSSIGAAMERAARAGEPATVAGLIDALEAAVTA